ncbi:MAG: helix-turn-helix domain-containing protein [Chloroflexota bacterium]
MNNAIRANRILDAAATLIAHYGYDKTTVSDIAREASVSKGAIYLHWPGKEQLFSALLVREAQQLLDDTMSRVEDDPQGGTIDRMYYHGLLALAAHPLMRALYTRDSRILGDYVRHQGPGRYTQRFLFGQAFVQRMQTASLIRDDLDATMTSYLFSIIAYGLMQIETFIASEQAPALEEVATALADLVRRGFAAENGDSEAGKQALRHLINEVKQTYTSQHEEQEDADD